MLTDKKKNEQPKKVFKHITCECGFKILLVPDLKAMVNAVDTHVSEHQRKQKDPQKAELESERIWNMLTAQIFQKAAASIEAAE